jgi:hypothetical protein
MQLDRCPNCLSAPFDQFLPGQFVRSNFWPWQWKRPRFSVICRACKQIVGYEWFPPSPADLALRTHRRLEGIERDLPPR